MPDASTFTRLRRLESIVAGNDGISRVKLRAPGAFTAYTPHRAVSLPLNAIGSNKFPNYRPRPFNPSEPQRPRPFRVTNSDPNASIAQGGRRVLGGGAASTPQRTAAGGGANSQQTSNMNGGSASG